MHLIIKGIDKVFTPMGNLWEKTWHGLQTAVKGGIALDGSNIQEAFCPIVECGVKADFEADVTNVPAELVEYMGNNPMNDWKLILADCRNGEAKTVIPLHVPKKGYTIHQNRTLFDCMVASAKAVCGDNGFEIVTVGTLGGYSQFFASIAIKGESTFSVGNIVGTKIKDTYQQFFNLNSSHNGLIASNRMLALTRMVCFNTVQISIAQATEAGTIAGIKHTVNSGEMITPAQFATDLQTWRDSSKTFQALLVATKAQPMTGDTFKAFAAGVFTNGGSDNLSTTSFNRIENDLAPAFATGDGNRGASVYDAINSFTQVFTRGMTGGKVATNKQVAMANFGRGNDWKLAAIKLATDEVALAETIKRGSIFYADKQKEMAAKN